MLLDAAVRAVALHDQHRPLRIPHRRLDEPVGRISPSFKDEPSLARTLKQAGYVTGMAGKWRQMGDTPGDWGFDEWLTDPTAGGWYWKTSYTKNGQLVETKQDVYCPDVCLDFTLDFSGGTASSRSTSTTRRTSSTARSCARRTASPTRKDFYEDNVAYLDKQVGQLVAELDKLGLREKTLIVFTGDNGTARFGADRSLINGRKINGQKGSMLEGGSRVPLIASWKGTMPAGKVLNDLVDFSDFFATFAELAGAKMPEGVTFDSRSFAPQLRGEKGTPRDWVFVQLGAKWYVREQGFKLTQSGELFDMSDAPFVEKPVAAGDKTRRPRPPGHRLQGVLDKLSPASGKTPQKRQGRSPARRPSGNAAVNAWRKRSARVRPDGSRFL